MIINNYYSLSGANYNFCPVKLISKTKHHFTFETIPEKEKKTLLIEFCILNELEILPSHIKKLGFDEAKKQDIVNGVLIIPIHIPLGTDLNKIQVDFFGYKVLLEENYETFKKSYGIKLQDIRKLSIDEYEKKRKGIRKSIINELGLILNVNELFDALERVEFPNFDKDNIIYEKNNHI